MDVVVARCAGLDVHKDTVVATVRVPGPEGTRHQETRTFRTTTPQIEALAGWLAGFGVTRVGMEATGVYWKPLWYVLEAAFDCWLLNARHMRNVPGRKTDVADSAWIAMLIEHGLVRASFVPPPRIRQLRDLTRYRQAQREERRRAVQRLDKILQDAGIKLSSVASRTLGVSARLMLEALIGGQRDPAALADLAKGRLRAKIPALQEALVGRFRSDHHGLIAAQILAHIDTLDAVVADLDAGIDHLLAPHADILELVSTIPGVGQHTAQVLIAECGADMSIFPSAAHLASWAGICPGNHASAGRRGSGKTRPGSTWLRHALTESAKAAARTRHTYLAAHHAQLRRRRGTPKAIGALRHDILIAYYHIVRDHTPYRELGPQWAQRPESSDHRTRRLVRQLQQLGHTVTLNTPNAT